MAPGGRLQVGSLYSMYVESVLCKPTIRSTIVPFGLETAASMKNV
jgi:hypothetical protein